MIAVRGLGLTQSFGARSVLGPLDLELEVGERLALLGPNGSGKTTLMRILSTLARPAAGSLELLGVDALRNRERVRPRIGHLGHQSAVHAQLTVVENLEFYCELYGLPGERALEALAEVGLEAFARRRAGEISRGMEQRLALARALLHDPELVFLDEPDSSLDGSGRSLLETLLQGRTVVLATHDLALARSVCGRELNLPGERARPAAPRLSVLG